MSRTCEAAVSEGGGEGIRAAFVTGLNRAFIGSVCLTALALTLSLLRGEAVEAPSPLVEGQVRSDSTAPSGDDD